MSRTDAHRPPFVWIADHPELRREHHDHTAGPCTLPANFAAAAQYAPGRCYVYLDYGVRVCGCNLCTGRLGRAFAQRRRRAAERTLLRAARYVEEEFLEQLEGDVWDRSRSTW